MSIYLTGDIHGNPSRLSQKNLKLLNIELNKNDVAIVLGDFGLPWQNTKEEEYWINWMKSKPFKILFIDGNHENFDILNQFEVINLYGGKAHILADNIFHLMRGEVYSIENKTFFCFGGATSIDRWWRIEHESWWREENFSDAEQQNALDNLDKHDYIVDYVLTHTGPVKFSELIPGDKQHYDYCPTADLLGIIEQKLSFKKWYYGHFHVDIDTTEKARCLYQDVMRIE